jgi:hypothetical protein
MTTRKNEGQTGGRLRDVDEKGDARRTGGGAGQQGHHGTSDREAGSAHSFSESQSEPLEAIELRQRRQDGNRERHADKQQPEEAGPGRVSKKPPERGRY